MKKTFEFNLNALDIIKLVNEHRQTQIPPNADVRVAIDDNNQIQPGIIMSRFSYITIRFIASDL